MSEESIPTAPSINEEKLEALLRHKTSQQNLPFAIAAGILSASIGAVIWAAVTVTTQYQIGWMAIGVGFLVGYAVRKFGKGMSQIYGVIGAGFALLGCLVGNFLSIIGFVANEEQLGYAETLGALNYAAIPELMMATFSPMDLLFYAIAIYQGYKLSFAGITEDEIVGLADEA